MNYQLEGLTLAVTRMEEMLSFYKAVFGLEFEEMEMHGFKLYKTNWADLSLLFCPAQLAQNTASQNRHQFDIIVSDLDTMIEAAKTHHGELMSEPAEAGGVRSVGIYDPDRNSMVFKQLPG